MKIGRFCLNIYKSSTIVSYSSSQTSSIFTDSPITLNGREMLDVEILSHPFKVLTIEMLYTYAHTALTIMPFSGSSRKLRSLGDVTLPFNKVLNIATRASSFS